MNKWTLVATSTPSLFQQVIPTIYRETIEAENYEEADKIAKSLIKKVLIFDVFEGGNIPEGKKSIAVNITIQSMEKTLSEKDLNEVSQKIINIVKAKTGGTIRS